MKQKLLISRCLLGKKCAYDGTGNRIPWLEQLAEKFDLIDVCPETDGGLAIPRTPSEISGGTGDDVISRIARVLSSEGEDRTSNFLKGAEAALKTAFDNEISVALLKANSPSCGNLRIYDGTFSGKLIEGKGIAAGLLEANGVRVYNEHQIQELLGDRNIV